jgi:hypothetical protein
MRSLSISVDTVILCLARSAPFIIADCASNADGDAIAASTDRTLATHVA